VLTAQRIALRPAWPRLALALSPPLLLAFALPFVVSLGPERGGSAPLAPWLHAPALLWCAAFVRIALDAWPTFGRDRPGAGWIERVPREPLRAAAACLLLLPAAAAGLALVALPFAAAAALRGHPLPAAYPHRPLAVAGDARLDLMHRDLAVQLPPGATRLRLQPDALLATGGIWAPAQLRVTLDERPLHDGWLAIDAHRSVVELELPAGAAGRLRIERQATPGILVAFPAGSIEAVAGDAPRAGALHAMLACGHWLLPLLLALGSALLLRRVVLLPLLHGMLVLLLLALALAPEPLPMAPALRAVADGRWPGVAPLIRSIGCGLLVAMTLWAVPPLLALGRAGAGRPA
jgi:hypothetical protein